MRLLMREEMRNGPLRHAKVSMWPAKPLPSPSPSPSAEFRSDAINVVE